MTEVFQQSPAKKLIGLSRHLTQWERFDETELGLERLAMPTLMATMDSVQPHWIALKSRVVLESPKAHMSSQYLCSTTRPDMSHIIHEVFITDRSGEMQHLYALIDYTVTSIFMALRLRKRLGLAYEPPYVTTLGLNGQVMAHASDCPETVITVQYMEHLSPVQELEVLVVPMRAYHLVLGLPWFQSRNPDVDRQHGRLLALRAPGEAEVVVVDQVDDQECPGNIPGSTAREEACSEEGGGSIPDIQILRATAFDYLLSSEQVVGTFFLRVGDCPGLLGATVEGITKGEWERPQVLDGRAGSSGGSCGRRASRREP